MTLIDLAEIDSWTSDSVLIFEKRESDWLATSNIFYYGWDRPFEPANLDWLADTVLRERKNSSTIHSRNWGSGPKRL